MKTSSIKRSLLIALATSALMIFEASCVRKCNGCQDGELLFRGFDLTNLQEITFREYSRGSDFKDCRDSVIAHPFAGKGLRTYAMDSGRLVYEPLENPEYVTAGYDYEILVPATGSMFRITDISCSDAKSSCSGSSMSSSDNCLCINALESYRINGTLHTTGSSGAENMSFNLQHIYLDK